MNPSGRKGADGENAVVRTLLPIYPMAERRAKQGSKDRGDIGGVAPGVVIEVKARPSRFCPSEWLTEADVEAANDRANLAVVWFKLKGKGNPLDWPVMMRGRYFLPMLQLWTGVIEAQPRQLELFDGS
jgi:hypothetical protein